MFWLIIELKQIVSLPKRAVASLTVNVEKLETRKMLDVYLLIMLRNINRVGTESRESALRVILDLLVWVNSVQRNSTVPI